MSNDKSVIVSKYEPAMMYTSYGARVFRGGVRQLDREDCPPFDDALLANTFPLCHGVLGSGAVRVIVLNGFGTIIIRDGYGSARIVSVLSPGATADYNYSDEYDIPHVFRFACSCEDGRTIDFIMVEPDGTVWRAEYGFEIGGGWDE